MNPKDSLPARSRGCKPIPRRATSSCAWMAASHDHRLPRPTTAPQARVELRDRNGLWYKPLKLARLGAESGWSR